MSKINQEEYEILKSLDEKWKWMARDKDRGLYAFTEKPVRKYDPSPYWDTETEEDYSALELFDEIHLFQFIQWEDDEPHNIAELIEEYESEETEVKKDNEWLKEEISNIEHKIEDELYKDDISFHMTVRLSGGLSTIKEIKKVINQLDEPEVLSQEWIKGHEQQVHPDHPSNAWWVPSDDLQNLLVPKQELPVIPEFVAEWVTAMHNGGFDLYPALKRLENNASYWEDVYNWYRKNTHDFVNVYLTGNCEVEEQKYYVINKQGVFALRKDTGGVANSRYTKKEVERLGELQYYQLTEQEIKDYDERYLAFKVPVEELEE